MTLLGKSVTRHDDLALKASNGKVRITGSIAKLKLTLKSGTSWISARFTC